MNMKKKHRYLFASYIQKPRDPHKTHIKGYVKDPANMRWDEAVGFSVGLKHKDEIRSQIVIDIDGQVVLKNTMSENMDWGQLMDYFLKAYEKQLLDFMRKTGAVQTEPKTAQKAENS